MPAFVYFTIGEIKNMGYYKDLMQMHQARGYGDSDKYVCQFCFGDTFLKKTILKQGEQGKCSFCKDAKGKPAKRKVLKLEKLMPYIMAAVDYEYEDSIVALPWDSEKKCYMGNAQDMNLDRDSMKRIWNDGSVIANWWRRVIYQQNRLFHFAEERMRQST